MNVVLLDNYTFEHDYDIGLLNWCRCLEFIFDFDMNRSIEIYISNIPYFQF